MHSKFDIFTENNLKIITFNRVQNPEFVEMVNGLKTHAEKKNADIVKHKYVKDIEFKHKPVKELLDQAVETALRKEISGSEIVPLSGTNAKLMKKYRKARGDSEYFESLHHENLKIIADLKSQIENLSFREKSNRQNPHFGDSAIQQFSSPDQSQSPIRNDKSENLSETQISNVISMQAIVQNLSNKQQDEEMLNENEEVKAGTNPAKQKRIVDTMKKDVDDKRVLKYFKINNREAEDYEEEEEEQEDGYGNFEYSEGVNNPNDKAVHK